MKRRYKVALIVVAALAAIAGSLVTVAGPWPTYKSGFEDQAYYKDALAAIERHGRRSSHGSSVGQFKAGWASRSITPPIGTPLAGFGDRQGKPSAGVHDELLVKALAVSDGIDTAVIVGADMLIIPENVADLVRTRVSQRTALTANEILLNASHNHSGLGAFGPGYTSNAFNGRYDPNIPDFLAGAFADAIVEAYRSLEPAKMTCGSVDAPEYIRNRTRSNAPVDSELSYMLVEQADGGRCVLVSYSAHATILGSDNMQFTGEFPGFLMRRITEKTGAEAIYLGGAVGSMSPRPPAGADSFDRCRAMGDGLADKVLKAIADAKPSQHRQASLAGDKVDVASIGFPIRLPPFQLRINEKWRVSKFLLPILGIDTDGWMHAVRIGGMALVGTPADYCGEISIELKSWAQARNPAERDPSYRGVDLWVLSFNGDYVGYISPDKYYYDKDENGGYGYERGLMSWIGPHQEAFTRSLITRMIDVLFPASQ